jgi:adenylate kinase
VVDAVKLHDLSPGKWLQMQSYRNIVLLGPPGSGKGTQAERLRDDLGLRHVSTGELVRAHPEQTERYTREGKLVPDDVVVGLLRDALGDEAGGVLLDGFPRSVAQAELLAAHLDLTDVVFLDVPDEAVIGRLSQRGREDDDAETVRKRLAVYREATEPLVGYYDERGLLRRVNGHAEPDEVALRVRSALS